ncbi:hypothetical protein IFM89_027148 [Coptis chinensis]|uniref:Signal recognition particle subunit SRP68 n=1 Tax=Coptis chinensis TaxID=261450 RepID=A0A835LT61_9MAGN|nr:hypothetical protein IFM89_027148 [Coptis chinensis]
MKKKKGSGISKTTYDKVADSFQKDGLLDDLDKLKGMYSNSQAENSMKQVASRISNVINEKDWLQDVGKPKAEVAAKRVLLVWIPLREGLESCHGEKTVARWAKCTPRHLIGRLRKAVKWATLFADLCGTKGDSGTSLEAEVYPSSERAWSHAMEKKQLPDGPNARQGTLLVD